VIGEHVSLAGEAIEILVLRARDPQLTGKILTRFVIGRDGKVESAMEAQDAPQSPLMTEAMAQDDQSHRQAPRFPDAEVTACVMERFKALTFPQPEGGIVTVVYPIVFAPDEG
jgi:hypothetical protein